MMAMLCILTSFSYVLLTLMRLSLNSTWKHSKDYQHFEK